MAEVVVANDDLVVLGGPAAINLSLDVGATGTRGSYIFNDIGKPTSSQISFSIPPIIGDLYININPSDSEYLYLYQYKLVNGVLAWTKILRLVPNTVLLNPYFKFIDGEAYTPIVLNNGLIFVRGIIASLAEAGLENEQVEQLDPRDLNIQLRVGGASPVMSNLVIEDINTAFTGITYIIAATGQTLTNQTVALDKRYMLARLKIAELNESTMELDLVDGYRKVDFFVNVGGRSELVLDIDQVEVASEDPEDQIEVNGTTVDFPGGLTIVGHSLSVGNKIVYLTNGNTAITGLTNGQEYFVAHIVDDTIVLSANGTTLVSLTSATKVKTHSIIDLGGIVINV
jgi:hypothetical protein